MKFTFEQTEWYAAPTGSPSGNGTILNPWDLQTALNNTSQILPGHILWLRGGVYRGQFDSNLQGTATKPITVQSFTGEKAILNGNTVFPTPIPTPNPALVKSNKDLQDKIKEVYWSLEPEQQAKFYENAVNDSKLNQEGLFLIDLPKPAILIAHKGYVHYKNFEITCLDFFEREFSTTSFFLLDGIRLHSDLAIGNKFIELIIYNNPGIGITSWKNSGDQEFNSCLIYNNGYTKNTTSSRGHGSGVYLQNQTDDIKFFNNNIVFNNYYIGFEIWSASSATPADDSDYVKNVDLNDNVVFKAGGGYSGTSFETNVLIATDWGTGQTTNPNIARNMNVVNNIMYHNTDYAGTSGFGTSLVLGWRATAPVNNINVYGNFISGINDAIRFNYADNTLSYNNNIHWGRYVYHQPYNATNCDITNWSFDNNLYYTNSTSAFRQFSVPLDRTMAQWQSDFSIDPSSSRSAVGNFTENTKIKQFDYSKNKYLVTLVRKNGSNVALDFATQIPNFPIPIGTPYRIIDIENYHSESILPFTNIYTGGTINFNLQSTAFEMPQNNSVSVKTPANFGCFIIEFAPYHTANGEVFTTNIQSDGKIIFGGDFTKYNETNSSRIARLNTDMRLDPTFTTGTGANETVRASVIDSSNKIIIGGKFTNYNGTARNYIARLNSDGTNDATFNIGTGIGISPSDGIEGIHAIAIQSDGKILVGGYFTGYNGTTRNSIARLNSDGTLDTSFTSGFALDSAIVYSIAIQSDGKILVGGSFDNYSSTSTNNIVRLNTNGAIDNTFITGIGFDNEVYAITIQSDGKILVGGKFNYYNSTNNTFLSRLLNNGSIDTTFTIPSIKRTGEGFGIKTIKVQSDNKIVIGGGFFLVSNISRKKIARLEAGGNLDTTFNPGTGFGPQEGRGTTAASNPRLNSISIQTDGKIVCGGYYTDYNQNPVKNMTRINPALTGTIARESASIEQNETKNNLPLNNVIYSDIRIYPVPFSNYINIESVNEKIDLIEIYNKNNSLIKSQKINSNKEQVLLDELSKDYYFFKIYNNGEIIKTGKLIKN